MPNNLVYRYKSGSRMWAAFLNGQTDPRQILSDQQLIPIAEEVRKEMNEFGELMREKFEDTVDGWSNKPTFSVEVTENIDRQTLKSEITATVEVTGAGAENWERVNQGTRPHTITPGTKNPNATYLKIRDYVRHTSPGIGIPKSNASGGRHRAQPYRRAKEVVQSIRPRKFTERIVQFYEGDKEGSFSRRIGNATRRALRRQKR